MSRASQKNYGTTSNDWQTGQNDFANAPQPLCLVFWNFSEQKLKEIEEALNKTRYTGIMARCHAL